ncbi:MAG: DUF493 domain-containing protein [Gammaproteobacteria bacterium]|nr:MAG: DUF493 domain-containing protein [Gammaproteobacteria bacterium]
MGPPRPGSRTWCATAPANCGSLRAFTTLSTGLVVPSVTQAHQGPLQFPCDFPIKVMGRASSSFELKVVEIVRRHVPDLGEGAVRSRLSREGKFVSITVTIRARSREQLDALYRELTADEDILMVL